ncbi:MAG: hypothetical protein ACJA2S_001987 [Cyclobacteriaceae bacterium]|jgi:hypothetical protein
MNLRLKYYIKTALICFIIGFILNYTLGEEFTLIALLAFNLIVFYRFKAIEHKISVIVLAVISTLFTTLLFILQYQYREHIDWGHIKSISDFQANLSYLLTTILFSAITWELGITFLIKKAKNRTHN